jgi:hypothetical protein
LILFAISFSKIALSNPQMLWSSILSLIPGLKFSNDRPGMSDQDLKKALVVLLVAHRLYLSKGSELVLIAACKLD